MVFRPHDLLWVSDDVDFCGLAPWVKTNWSFTVPVVVRRDTHPQGLIPVGIRGDTRDRRAAGWVAPHQIVRCVTPEQLANPAHIAASPFAAMAPTAEMSAATPPTDRVKIVSPSSNVWAGRIVRA